MVFLEFVDEVLRVCEEYFSNLVYMDIDKDLEVLMYFSFEGWFFFF